MLREPSRIKARLEAIFDALSNRDGHNSGRREVEVLGIVPPCCVSRYLVSVVN